MKLVNAELAMTTNINVAQMIATEPNAKIIFVGDTVGYEQVIQYYRMIPASPLVPDYSVMEADINGDDNEFKHKYACYLSSEPAKMFFATIIAALGMGRNILLFIPPEANGLKYPVALMEYMWFTYGLQTRTESIPFGYNESYTPQNAAMLYMYNMISPAQYLMVAGENFGMIDKLIYDMKLPISNTTDPNKVYAYFNEYRLDMLKHGKELQKPFVRGV